MVNTSSSPMMFYNCLSTTITNYYTFAIQGRFAFGSHRRLGAEAVHLSHRIRIMTVPPLPRSDIGGKLHLDEHTLVVIGIMISALASLFGALSKVMFKMAHKLSDAQKNRKDAAGAQQLVEQPSNFFAPAPADAENKVREDVCLGTWGTWGTALLFVGLGACLDVVSYYVTPQRILAPLMGLCIVWNIVLARCLLQEIPTCYDALSCCFVFVGCGLASAAVAVSYTQLDYEYKELLRLFSSTRFILYSVVVVSLMCLLFACASINLDKAQQKLYGPIIYGVGAGLVGGQLCFTKAAALLFHPAAQTPWIDRHMAGTTPDVAAEAWPYVIVLGAVISAAGGLLLLSEALRRYDALKVRDRGPMPIDTPESKYRLHSPLPPLL